MRRDDGDDSWNFIRIYANIRKDVYMNPLGDGHYECVYLKSHPALSTSNSDFPTPGSWHSKDVFTPHPFIPDVWKYVTRIDDRITLVNGEKVLPLPIEGRIREDSLVREAVVVGVDRPIPGLLVFRATLGDHLSDEAYLDAIWPSIVDANSRAEKFSQITREMVALIPSDVEYPQTDKRSAIRSQVYSKFAHDIDEMYARLFGEHEGSLQLDLPDLEDYLLSTFRDAAEVPLESLDTDFFTAGVDSLKAIQTRRIIQENLQLNGHQLCQNIVYSTGNIRRLARYLHTLANSEKVEETDERAVMKDLIDRFSRFHEHKSLNGFGNGHGSKSHGDGHAVILTGATGSIGAHLLVKLIALDSIDRVYCFCRGKNPILRVLRALGNSGVDVPKGEFAKIIALTTDLDEPDFGLDADTMSELRREVSLIVHGAWPVNFNLPLQSFEPQIAGLHNLLQFSLSVQRPDPAQVYFCSSISVALNAPENTVIPEAPIEDFCYASRMGYAQSKLVGEHVVRNAALVGARSYVLRIGQVVGDTVHGVWNDNQNFPLMIRSALQMRALPALDECCSWLPVDTLAASIVDLFRTLSASPTPRQSNSDEPLIFYNLVNSNEFSWSELLSELCAAGLEFETVPFSRWLDMLQESAAKGEEKRNPAIKLIEYYQKTYGAGERGVRFDSQSARQHSEALSSAPEVVTSGLLRRFLDVWMQRWE
ncbi:NRPS-like enzyme [Aspergillus sp. HF37]|nr:NRPS-like enzyme [Aspergillus sp. HF37]